MNTIFEQSKKGGWEATTVIDIGECKRGLNQGMLQLVILTRRSSIMGELITSARTHLKHGKMTSQVIGGDYSDLSTNLARSQKRATDKAVHDQHEHALRVHLPRAMELAQAYLAVLKAKAQEQT